MDPEVLRGRHLTFHLFFGPHNKKLDVEVVEALLENAQAVRLIRSPKSGKNALDFVLAYHLGQAVMADPKGSFHIVSKDTGFDALVEFLESKNVDVQRHMDWSGFHIGDVPKPAAPPPKIAKPRPLSEIAAKLLADLEKTAATLPKRKKGLLGRAKSALGKQGTEEGCESLVKELVESGKLEIDEKGAVRYSF